MRLVFGTLDYGIVAGPRVRWIRSRAHLAVDLEMRRPPTTGTNGTVDDDGTYFGRTGERPMAEVHRTVQRLRWVVRIGLHSGDRLRVITPTWKMLRTF